MIWINKNQQPLLTDKVSYCYSFFRWLLFEDGKEKRTKEGEKPDLLTSKKAEFDLTIVVPAYNEEARLPVMMKDTIAVGEL